MPQWNITAVSYSCCQGYGITIMKWKQHQTELWLTFYDTSIKPLKTFYWLSVELKHGDRLKVFEQLLPWRADGIIEWATLIQWLLRPVLNPRVWVLLPPTIDVSCLSRLLYHCRFCAAHPIPFQHSLHLCSIYVLFTQSFWMSLCTVHPPRLIYSLFLYQASFGATFCNSHDQIVLSGI